MTDSEKKNHIILILRRESKQARDRHINEVSEHAALKVKKEWRDVSIKNEDFGGGFGSPNHFDEALKRAEVSMNTTEKDMERHDEILNYAINIFLK